ncbi:uncharacterized protein TNCV_2724691 [Trichonephila clavipes]|nr:uncharacterized protein TNCV_2724691 [Trichonephila clavipes]
MCHEFEPCATKASTYRGDKVHYISFVVRNPPLAWFGSSERPFLLTKVQNYEQILGGDQGFIPEIIYEILTTARDLELEVNEDDIEELIMEHEDELRKDELQKNLNEEYQKTQRNVSPSEQEEDERGPMTTSAIKDLLKKWADVRAMVLEWHPNQADVSRVGDLYNKNAINYLWKILKKREKQSTLDMFYNPPISKK